MKRFLFGWAAACLVLGVTLAMSPSHASAATRDRAAEVRAAERAFAKTMADRDLKSFGGYIAVEGVFFGRNGAIRGRKAVVEAWTKFFDGPEAPFSWDPETIEVLKSGRLALSSGPVKDPKGAVIGTFSTIWRLEPDGKWRVVFDKGCPVCEPEKSGS
jgi:ketosteroid isomerase-like protein